MIDRIRPFIFETNSSLTNALILFDKDTYKKWCEDPDLYINIWEESPKLYTEEEATASILGCDAESAEDNYLSESELKCEGFINSVNLYEYYEVETLDLEEEIGQRYIVLSACKEDR